MIQNDQVIVCQWCIRRTRPRIRCHHRSRSLSKAWWAAAENPVGNTACDLSLALSLKLFSSPRFVHSLWQFSSNRNKCVVITCFISFVPAFFLKSVLSGLSLCVRLKAQIQSPQENWKMCLEPKQRRKITWVLYHCLASPLPPTAIDSANLKHCFMCHGFEAGFVLHVFHVLPLMFPYISCLSISKLPIDPQYGPILWHLIYPINP